MRTGVPTEGYAEVKKVGEVYVVHLEPEVKDNGLTECWECVEREEPDLVALSAQLQEYKTYILARELAVAKEEKVKALMRYDESEAVNSFEIRKQGVKVTDYWLDRDLRTSLEGDVIAAQSVGDTYKFDIREMGITLELNCNKFLEALARLRRYAYTAFNQTSAHMDGIRACETKEEVEAYDYTQGYPEKLVFDIEELM